MQGVYQGQNTQPRILVPEVSDPDLSETTGGGKMGYLLTPKAVVKLLP